MRLYEISAEMRALNAEEQRRSAAPLTEPWDDLVGAAARGVRGGS